MNWLGQHFQRYRERTPWDFCWRITIEGTIVSLIVAIAAYSIGVPERDIAMDFETLVILAVLVAPVLETLLLQVFPTSISRRCGATFPVQVAVATIVFAVAHLAEGPAAFIAAGIVGGFYFGFTYVHWRTYSRWTALWVTALSHAIHNAIAVCLMATEYV